MFIILTLLNHYYRMYDLKFDSFLRAQKVINLHADN